MADATQSPTSHRVPLRQNAGMHHPATYPLPSLAASIDGQRERGARHLQGNPIKAAAAIAAKRQQWASMDLRQEWADTDFMRGHLRMAGLRINATSEPATVPRMKSKLRSIGVHSPEIQEAIGMTLEGFLKVNPRLPLWAALALVLESIGRFTPEMGGASHV